MTVSNLQNALSSGAETIGSHLELSLTAKCIYTLRRWRDTAANELECGIPSKGAINGGNGLYEELLDSIRSYPQKFPQGAGVFGVGAAAAALVGCSPQGQGTTDSTDVAPASNGEGAAPAEKSTDIWSIPELGEPDETIQAEVCIIGGGGTGLAAAVQAIDLGLKPLVIEREAGFGGSFQGTEGMTALESKYTRDDPPYLATAYWPDQPYGIKNCMFTCLNYHHWIPSYKVYKNWFENSSDTIDWLEGHGQEFTGAVAIGTGPKIWHVYKHDEGEAPGYAFISKFAETAQSLGVEARFNTFARHLVMDGDKVAGVLCEDTDDKVLKVESSEMFRHVGCC